MVFAIRKTLKAIFLVATTLAMAVAISNYTFGPIKTTTLREDLVKDQSKVVDLETEHFVSLPSKKVSRFLAANPPNKGGRNPNAADHCHKDYDVCTLELGANSTCCGNKCFDLITSKNHCGSCHNKCKYTYDCCRGKCVDLAFDKRHCGGCNQRCLDGQYCIYGMCDYA